MGVTLSCLKTSPVRRPSGRLGSHEMTGHLHPQIHTSPLSLSLCIPSGLGSEETEIPCCLHTPPTAASDSLLDDEDLATPCPRRLHTSPMYGPAGLGSEDMTRHLHPQTQIHTSPVASPDSLLDDDDLLWEILLRLQPQPSSLPRASSVCKRWQRVTIDLKFLHGFFAHHRKPPVLGVFERRVYNIVFRPILDPPNRIPPECFDLRRHGVQTDVCWSAELHGCRHGRVLLMDARRHKVIVWDPITGEHHHVHTPLVSGELNIYGAVLCAAADQGHVHGNCHSSPFKVVLMYLYGTNKQPIACVYSSETGTWGNTISATAPCKLCDSNPGILVGNVLYWSSKSVSPNGNFPDLDLARFTDDIIEFDLDRQSLAVIKGPPGLNESLMHQIIQADDNGVGLAILSHGRFEMWQRKLDCHDGATWLLQKNVEIHTILGLPPHTEESMRVMEILGYDDDNGVIFLHADGDVYMVQLMSMQLRKLYESHYTNKCHPFTSFYAPAISCGCDGAEMLYNT